MPLCAVIAGNSRKPPPKGNWLHGQDRQKVNHRLRGFPGTRYKCRGKGSDWLQLSVFVYIRSGKQDTREAVQKVALRGSRETELLGA